MSILHEIIFLSLIFLVEEGYSSLLDTIGFGSILIVFSRALVLSTRVWFFMVFPGVQLIVKYTVLIEIDRVST